MTNVDWLWPHLMDWLPSMQLVSIGFQDVLSVGIEAENQLTIVMISCEQSAY